MEATSFVSPKWVPQLADADAVLAGVTPLPGVRYPVLTPNLKGLERALAAGAVDVAVFAAATESFSRRNLNASIAETLARYRDVIAAAKEAGARVRGYVSVAVGCPYEGAVRPAAAAAVAAALHAAGCYEVSLGDTTGVGTPASVAARFAAAKEEVPVAALASHCHDTYGQGVANVLAALAAGVSVHDASVAGLGGCPFAPGASGGRGGAGGVGGAAASRKAPPTPPFSPGNVATEDVVYMLHGLGIETGIDVPRLLSAADHICAALGRPSGSRAGRAMRAAAEAAAERA